MAAKKKTVAAMDDGGAMGQGTEPARPTYVDGFLLAAPSRNKQAYVNMAAAAWPFFQRYGAVSTAECWGDDVPDGKINSMRSAVLLAPDETPVFSWVTWPDKAVRDAGMKAMMQDPDMKAPPEMPFDGKRMIYAGFDVLLGDAGQTAGYIDGTVIPVPANRRADYSAAAAAMADLFREHGALSVVDCWGDDVPEGKVNSFHTAILRQPDEQVVFSWIGWKDKAARDAGWAGLMNDPRMEQHSPRSVGADMSRMIFGGYAPVFSG